MPLKKTLLLTISILTLFAMGGCNMFASRVSPEQVETAVVSTAQAQLTQISINTLVAKLTELAMASPTPLPPTATEVPPTMTATLTGTPTQIPPTVTSTPVGTSTLTATALPSVTVAASTTTSCYAIKFIADVTIPDDTGMTPNQTFVKTWRLQNTGTCAWQPDFEVIFVGGSTLGTSGAQKLNNTVNPGQTIDVSISMTAPATSGTYQGDWKLKSTNGVIYGLGKTGSVPFWVKIQVGSSSSSTSASGVVLDFAGSYCQATWTSSVKTLTCPSAANDFTNGSITYTAAPKLEGGYQDDEPSLVLIPSDGGGGYISGRFPAITVQSSDRFQALIGCLDASPNCNVMFQLNYSAGGGAVQSLGSWTEISDGNKVRIDVPLGSLAGQSVQFILHATNNNGTSADDRLFLLVPVIKR